MSNLKSYIHSRHNRVLQWCLSMVILDKDLATIIHKDREKEYAHIWPCRNIYMDAWRLCLGINFWLLINSLLLAFFYQSTNPDIPNISISQYSIVNKIKYFLKNSWNLFMFLFYRTSVSEWNLCIPPLFQNDFFRPIKKGHWLENVKDGRIILCYSAQVNKWNIENIKRDTHQAFQCSTNAMLTLCAPKIGKDPLHIHKYAIRESKFHV